MYKKAAIVAALAAALSGCAHLGGWDAVVNNGQGLDNFNRTGEANWRVADGALVADAGKGGYLVSKGSYRDFEIRAEFWAETDTNSGIFIRCADPAKPGADSCYEVNIWDIRPDPKFGTGAIVNYAAVPVPLVHRAGGRWNVMEVTARGDEIVVKLNGAETARLVNAKHPSGPFALQYGAGVNQARGGPIKWRKVEVRPL
jgi:hypothetical protein